MQNGELSIKQIEYIAKKTYPPNARYTISNLENYRMMYVHEGRAEIGIDGRRLCAGAGDLLVFPPKKTYTVESFADSDWSFTVLAFSVTEESSLLHEGPVPFSYSEGMPLFNRVLSLWLRKMTGDLSEIKSILYHVLSDLERKNGADENIRPEVKKAVSYLRLHCGEKITLSSLAEECNCSLSTFKRLFQAQMRQSPIAYLNLYRIQKAEELLRSGMFSVEEAAAECGFDNVYYFSRVFKEKTGCSPGKYRKSFS